MGHTRKLHIETIKKESRATKNRN